MIMRRLAQSLKDQNWTAICIEFVLLVLGVFLGIQAQQWVNERAERQLERVYLERILTDIRISIESDQLNATRLTASSDGISMVLNRLRRCELSDSEKDVFADALAHVRRVAPSVFVLNTMEEMLSSGKFSIIRNSKIRDVLNGLARDANYQDKVYAAKIAQVATASVAINPHLIRTYIEHKTPFDPVRWDELDLNFIAMCQDRAFHGALSRLKDIADAGISLNNRALDKLRIAQIELERELGTVANAKETAP